MPEGLRGSKRTSEDLRVPRAPRESQGASKGFKKPMRASLSIKRLKRKP